MSYTITAVNPKTRTYPTKYGEMIAYQVKFEEIELPVEISQKLETPAPQVGQVLDGSVDMSGQYGPKFKKEFNNQGNFQQRSPASASSTVSSSSSSKAGGSTSGSATDNSPYTMFLSYAKDILVAQMETGGYDADKYSELLKAATEGGKFLYDLRPGAPVPEQPKLDKVVEDVFGDPGEGLPTTAELPWPENG